MPDGSEGGIRPQTVEFARETTTGIFPTSAVSLLTYSDNITGLSWSPSAGIEARRGLGSPDVSGHFNGPEEHEVTVSYDLQQFPVDATGVPVDAIGDAMRRSGDNELTNTHALRVREDNTLIPAGQTVNGAVSKSTNLYLVGAGGYPASATLTGDPGSDQPVQVELSYQFEKVREYQVDQPDASATIEFENLGTVDHEIKIEGSSTSAETVTVPGGGTATTNSDFASIIGCRIVGNEGVADGDGDVVVRQGVGGDDLFIIRGSDWYGHGEGDLGVPCIDQGSQQGALNVAYETILGDVVERPQNTGLAYEINSVEFAVENNIESREQVGRPVMAMDAGNRDVTATATIVGATESVQSAEQHLGNRQQDFYWYLDGGSLQATNAPLTDFSGVDKSSGQAAMSLDNTFEGQGLNLSQGATP